jgi:hypothetical protein
MDVKAKHVEIQAFAVSNRPNLFVRKVKLLVCAVMAWLHIHISVAHVISHAPETIGPSLQSSSNQLRACACRKPLRVEIPIVIRVFAQAYVAKVEIVAIRFIIHVDRASILGKIKRFAIGVSIACQLCLIVTCEIRRAIMFLRLVRTCAKTRLPSVFGVWLRWWRSTALLHVDVVVVGSRGE